MTTDRKGRILVVDDNESGRYATAHIIRQAGFEVMEAGTGAEALRLAGQQPDLVVLDVNLPDISGREVCRRIKGNPQTADLRIVHLSATFVRSEDKVAGLEDGADGYLVQPVEPEELIATIRAFLRLREAEQARRESDGQFRAVFEHMAAASCVDEIVYEQGKAVDYRILEVNAAYERITGIPRQKAVGALASALYGTGDAPCLEIFRQVAETGEPATFETWFAPIRKHLFFTVGRPVPGKFSTVFSDVTEKKLAEERLRLAALEYQTLAENLPDLVARFDAGLRHLYVNPAAARAGTLTQKEYIGKTIGETGVSPATARIWEDRIRSVFESGKPLEVEAKFPAPQGAKTFHTIFVPEKDSDGRVHSVLSLARDVTERILATQEREKLQAQVSQAQKMESVGRLAGGVAHDFNNMLGVILGYTELALGKVDPSEPLHGDLTEIYGAARRSSEITRQLLAFARQQPISPRILDLNEAVQGTLKMLRRLIGEDIDLAWLPKAGLAPVKMDPSQIDQILANLCVNARDAIPGVGKISIETDKNTFENAESSRLAGMPPGEFVVLAVSDNGCGMDRGTQDKLFEPFFTTKGPGKGTGLGLATVYGIVKQNGGFINVYSEPGRGTTFRIYLPSQETPILKSAEKTQVKNPCGHGETLLLVEDEKALRELCKKFLEKLGYQVLVADTADEALRLMAENATVIRLLITDVVMPKMDGRELADRLTVLKPNLTCLYMSGYTADVVIPRGVRDDGAQFIQKPFSLKALADKIKAALADKIKAALALERTEPPHVPGNI